MSNLRKLTKGEYLFREGDPCEEMFVIKTGRIAITKAKGRDEIILAEKNGGEMLGEMGFFDSKPRSAGARAVIDTEIITLPFAVLHAQFKTFPEWLKAMVKTIIGQLREANSRIKNIENAAVAEDEVFPPHLTTRLFAILSLIGFKSGEKTPEGLEIPHQVLRDYCIQVFQQPTNKMDRLLDVLHVMGHAKVEDLGDQKKRIVLINHQVLADYADWHNRYVFAEPNKRVTVEEKDMNALRALAFYGRRETPDHRGVVTVNLTNMQANAPADLGFPFSVNDADPLADRGLAQEKRSVDGGLSMSFQMTDVAAALPLWEIFHTLRKLKPR